MTAGASLPHATGREPGWVDANEHATTNDMLAACSASYRQIDYWTRCDYLRAEVATPGSGQPRLYPAVEQRVADAMCRLIEAGVACETAAHIARLAVTEQQTEFTANGVTIKVEVHG